jgi:hypothetical protein
LHKGQLTSAPKAELRTVADEWQWIFAKSLLFSAARKR